ncbi:hypothetical protein HAX54_039457 [Datura stramonium]|uniref:Uncharacterized protein n=1 Tax=Datura stramonium TaxID=4076 RepID=A0ABS8VQN0_DATST|nr:hypothetical protein [Datura stramonium]
MDLGGEYDLKHADLEKTFGAKVSSSGTKFWSKNHTRRVKTRFKKAKGRDLSAAVIAAKEKNSWRSASSSLFVFQGKCKSRLCKALSISDKSSSTDVMGVKTADGPRISSEEIAAGIMSTGANSRDDSHRFEAQQSWSPKSALCSFVKNLGQLWAEIPIAKPMKG